MNRMINQKIIIIGPPGSGKDTQADLLSQHFKIPKISIGEILRQEINKQTNIGKGVQFCIENAKMPKSNIGTKLFIKIHKTGSLNRGYVMVGFPRSTEALDNYLSLDTPTTVIYLKVSKKITLQRILKRKRIDDLNKINIENRYEEFLKNEIPVIKKLKKLSINIIEINGDNEINSIHKKILDQVKKIEKANPPIKTSLKTSDGRSKINHQDSGDS